MTACEQAFGQPLGAADHFEQGSDPAVGEHVAPVTHASREVVDLVVVCCREPGGVPPDERRQRCRPHQPGAIRLLEGSQQGQPLARRRAGEHRAHSGQHRGHAGVAERIVHSGCLPVRADQNCDVTGRHLAWLVVVKSQCRGRVQQPCDVGREVGTDEGPDGADRCQSALGEVELFARHES